MTDGNLFGLIRGRLPADPNADFLVEPDAARLGYGAIVERSGRLANLFVDMPATAEQHLDPPDEKADAAGNLPPGVLADLLRDGGRCLDPEAVYHLETATGPGARCSSC